MVSPEDMDTFQQGSNGTARNRKQCERKTGVPPMRAPKWFEGKTSKMAGHVLKTQKESSTTRQFKKTIEQLERWCRMAAAAADDLEHQLSQFSFQ